MKEIKVILVNGKKYWKEIFIVITIISCFLSIRNCNDNKREIERQKHNTAAALDSVRYYKDKNGDLYAEKLSYILTQKELERINEEMSENIKALNKKILAGVNAIVTIYDTIPIIDTVYIDNSLSSQSLFVDVKDDILSGRLGMTYYKNDDSPFLEPRQFTYSLNLPMEVYFSKDYSVILKVPGKNNVSFSNVTSFIDPVFTTKAKPKRWGIGFSIGIGGSPYNMINNKWGLHVGPYVGGTINYNMVNF